MLLLAKNIKLHPYICLIDQKKKIVKFQCYILNHS